MKVRMGLFTSSPKTLSGFIFEGNLIGGCLFEKSGGEISCRLSKVMTSPFIIESISQNLPEIIPLIASSIDNIMPQIGGTQRRASIGISDSIFRIIISQLSHFPSRHKEREEVLLWQFKKAIPYPLEKARLSYEVIENGKESTKVLSVIANSDEIGALENIFDERGMTAGIIAPSTLILYNALESISLFNSADDYMLINISQNNMGMLFVSQMKPSFYRCKNICGGDIDAIKQEIRLTMHHYSEKISQIKIKKAFIRNIYDPSLNYSEILPDGVEIKDISSLSSGIWGRDDSNSSLLFPIAGSMSHIGWHLKINGKKNAA